MFIVSDSFNGTILINTSRQAWTYDRPAMMRELPAGWLRIEWAEFKLKAYTPGARHAWGGCCYDPFPSIYQ
jgi:hypothetical protein